MNVLEFSLLVIIPLLFLFALIVGIFITSRQHKHRAEEQDENFRARYGNSLNKEIENRKRIWAMFGLEYPGPEHDEGLRRCSTDEECPPDYAEALRAPIVRADSFNKTASSTRPNGLDIRIPPRIASVQKSAQYQEEETFTPYPVQNEPLSPTRLNSVHRKYSTYGSIRMH